MKAQTLEALAPLLRFLRSYEVLKETEGCKFLLKGKDFVHFHDDRDGLWADAKLTKGRVRLSVADTAGQRELMEMVATKLDSLETHSEKRHQKKSRRKDA